MRREWLAHNHVLKKRKFNIRPNRVQEISKEERAVSRNRDYGEAACLTIFPKIVAKPVFDAVVMYPLLLPWTLESELRDHTLVSNAV